MRFILEPGNHGNRKTPDATPNANEHECTGEKRNHMVCEKEMHEGGRKQKKIGTELSIRRDKERPSYRNANN